MKKAIVLFLSLVCTLGLIACTQKEYKVEFARDYGIVNSLKETYAPGEEVTVELATFTEGWYVLYVNGVEQEISSSDSESTYFTFTMPSEDVLITIEERDADFGFHE